MQATEAQITESLRPGRDWSAQPRQGRKNLAQGASPGFGVAPRQGAPQAAKEAWTRQTLAPLRGSGSLRGLFPRARALG